MINIRKSKLEISEANWKIIAYDLIGKLKARKSIIIKSVKLENLLKISKKMITSVMKEKIRISLDERKKVILEKWEKVIKLNNRKIFRKVELYVSTKKMWSETVKFIRDRLEKERIEAEKRKIKRLKQKWRKLVKKEIIKKRITSLKQAKNKLKLSEEWGMFKEQICLIGVIIKIQIDDQSNRTQQKRKLLKDMIKTNAMNLKSWFQLVKEKYDRKMKFGWMIKDMNSSLMETENQLKMTEQYEETKIKWRQCKIDEEYLIFKQFEKNNVFFFNRTLWNQLRDRKIWLSRERNYNEQRKITGHQMEAKKRNSVGLNEHKKAKEGRKNCDIRLN
jgi:hypothetical protein